MQKNFDEERAARPKMSAKERTFIIGGETFVHRTADEIWPDMTLALDELGPDTSERDSLKILDELILDLIEGSGHERWRKLRARRTDPITVSDITELINWLLQAVSGLPPTQSEPSLPTQETNGQPSTETSSSEPAEVLTIST